MTYKNIISGVNRWVKYHDDMNEKDATDEVHIIPFPYSDIFVDFRVFNGITLDQMDGLIGRIKEVFVEIANIHAENEREEKLKALQFQSSEEQEPTK